MRSRTINSLTRLGFDVSDEKKDSKVPGDGGKRQTPDPTEFLCHADCEFLSAIRIVRLASFKRAPYRRSTERFGTLRSLPSVKRISEVGSKRRHTPRRSPKQEASSDPSPNLPPSSRIRSPKLWLIIAIFLLSGWFRFHDLGILPPGLWFDEAMNGVNAMEALESRHFPVFYEENNGWKVYSSIFRLCSSVPCPPAILSVFTSNLGCFGSPRPCSER